MNRSSVKEADKTIHAPQESNQTVYEKDRRDKRKNIEEKEEGGQASVFCCCALKQPAWMPVDWEEFFHLIWRNFWIEYQVKRQMRLLL